MLLLAINFHLCSFIWDFPASHVKRSEGTGPWNQRTVGFHRFHRVHGMSQGIVLNCATSLWFPLNCHILNWYCLVDLSSFLFFFHDFHGFNNEHDMYHLPNHDFPAFRGIVHRNFFLPSLSVGSDGLIWDPYRGQLTCRVYVSASHPTNIIF